MRSTLLVTLVLLGAGLTGCLGEDGGDPGDGGDGTGGVPGIDDPSAITFGEPMLIDETRAGGEPVIAVTHEGTLVISAHPGWTHVHPAEDPTNPPDEAITPASGQSYLWRSTDGGETWTHVGTPEAPEGRGPRGLGFGVSDPEFTVTDSNRIYHTDLEALASASVSWSDDDGATWVEGNPIASQGPVDRQWLASHGDTVYFTANYFTDHRILASEDGIVWERVGDVPCSGDIVASRLDGTLYAGCGAGIAVSEDGGATWTVSEVEGHEESGNFAMTEPAIDSTGNVWMAWQEDEHALFLAGSPDNGETWPWVYELTDQIATTLDSDEVTMVWPWISAGSTGRLAVTVFASPGSEPSTGGAADRPWSVVTVAAFGAQTGTPRVAGHLVDAVFHTGPICQSGTACQVGSVQGDDASDRRLGDFFETTIDADGHLHITYSETDTHPDDVVSHPAYVRQMDGPAFVVDDYFPTQG